MTLQLWLGTVAVALLTAGCDAPPPDKPLESVPQPAPVRSPDTESEKLITHLLYEISRDPVLRGADIRVSVTPDGMRLSGYVHTAAAKLRAAELAHELGGTPHIDNRLIVRRANGLAQRPIDGMVFL
jgi:hypothetical protein